MLHLVTFLLTSGCVTFCSQSREYYLINERLSWYEAQMYCRDKYTDLATIERQDDKMRLDDATASPSHELYIWIGLMKTEVESWKWFAEETQTSHELAEYTNWDHLPHLYHYCGSMMRNGKWHSVSCETTLPFLCQGGDESTWTYTLLEDKSWREAQYYCRLNNTDLISVRSDTENQALMQALNETAPILGNWSEVWIGLYRDDWTWSDQSTSSFRYWGESQPESVGDCGAYDPIDKKWYEMECTHESPFVCYHDTENVQRHIVKVEIKTNSVFEFSEAAMSDSLLTQIQKKHEGVKIWWRVQPDGKIFHEKETKKIIEAC